MFSWLSIGRLQMITITITITQPIQTRPCVDSSFTSLPRLAQGLKGSRAQGWIDSFTGVSGSISSRRSINLSFIPIGPSVGRRSRSRSARASASASMILLRCQSPSWKALMLLIYVLLLLHCAASSSAASDHKIGRAHV